MPDQETENVPPTGRRLELVDSNWRLLRRELFCL
jgi:hypothetical protein